ncbi:MAG TPA: OsmC family protein [Vicinamibacterales bacterium]|nr:OsmC family protein [Vicinamibacterales bacterium]
MQDLPHHYAVTVAGAVQGDVELTAERLPNLHSASPAEFDGPGDHWSPETLLVGAVGDCFILTFRAVARASKLPWTSLRCHVTGTLDCVDRVTQFTHLHIHAHLMLQAGTDPDFARRALEKAERSCLISNSLKATVHFEPAIDIAAEQAAR